jgi:hypothetical protein
MKTDRTASKELGHVHTFGVLDILFTKAIREQLVAEGKVREHHYVPKSGWTTYHLNRSDAVPHALWLLRLSYVLQVLRLTKDKAFAAAELERLHVSAALRALVLPERAQNGRRA